MYKICYINITVFYVASQYYDNIKHYWYLLCHSIYIKYYNIIIYNVVELTTYFTWAQTGITNTYIGTLR